MAERNCHGYPTVVPREQPYSRARSLYSILTMLGFVVALLNLTTTIPILEHNGSLADSSYPRGQNSEARQQHQRQLRDSHSTKVHRQATSATAEKRWISETFTFASDTDNVTYFLTQSVLPDNETLLPCLESSLPTSRIRLYQQQQEQDNVWKIQTFDAQGNPKTKGGDVFFLTYTSDHDHHRNQNMNTENNKKKEKKQTVQDTLKGPNRIGKYGGQPPTATALVEDHEDGTYSLDFVRTPFRQHEPSLEQGGVVTVHMEYTCGMGRMTRPTKDTWKTGGYLYPEFARLHLDNANLKTPLPLPPPLRDYHQSTPIDQDPRVDLSQYDKVVFWGDSLMEMFSGKRDGHLVYYHANIEHVENDGDVIRSDLLETRGFARLEQNHGDTLRLAATSDKKIAILMGSAAWEMAMNEGPLPGHDFANSLDMYQRMIQGIRERYPNVTILWKSPQAVHLTNSDYETCISNPKCNDRIRYVSNSISRYLHDEQMKIMAQLDVPVLDIWEACYLSPHAHFYTDFQHYHENYNMLLLDMFYPPTQKLGPTDGYYTDLKRLKSNAVNSFFPTRTA